MLPTMLFASTVDATIFAPLWLGWLLLFTVVELLALKREKPNDNSEGGTFSELIWRLRKNKVFLVVFWLLWLVLGYHFLIGPSS